MITTELSPKQFLKMTRVIYFALWCGLMTFLIMTLFLIDNKHLFNVDISDQLMLVTFILSCINLPAGYLIAKMIFSKTDQNDLLKNKLQKYQTGQIIRLAFSEGVGLLSIISLLLTSNLFFLVFLLIVLFIMIQYFPTPEKIGKAVTLTPTEIDLFNN
jgi:hypothetical protein